LVSSIKFNGVLLLNFLHFLIKRILMLYL